MDNGPEYTYSYFYRALNNQIKLDEHEKNQADTLVQLNKLASGGKKNTPLAAMRPDQQVNGKQQRDNKRLNAAKGKGKEKPAKQNDKNRDKCASKCVFSIRSWQIYQTIAQTNGRSQSGILHI